MKKIGIMGGTFNPIHMGHLIIAEKAREQSGLDKVLFMPSGIPYMKDSRQVLPGKVRAQMTELAIRSNPFFDISTMEVEREGRTYTYETLETLRAQNPDTKYYFILGADSLWKIEEWRYPERIFAACHILAAVREEKTTEDMKEQIHYLEKHMMPILRFCRLAAWRYPLPSFGLFAKRGSRFAIWCRKLSVILSSKINYIRQQRV